MKGSESMKIYQMYDPKTNSYSLMAENTLRRIYEVHGNTAEYTFGEWVLELMEIGVLREVCK